MTLQEANTKLYLETEMLQRRLLDEIHDKQQLLDQLDYLIYQINHQKGGDFL